MINKPFISAELVIDITFSAFILFMIYFYFVRALKSTLDYILANLAIIISLIVLFIKNKNIVDIAHFLYTVVFLFIVTFISKNLYFLGLNILMLILILYSRKYYNECILGLEHDNIGFFARFGDLLEKKIKYWDFDYIFIILLVVSFYRYMKIKN